MTPRIVVLDGHTLNPGDNPWDPVSEHGELEVYDTTAESDIVERASDAEIVLTNKTPLSAETLARLESLEFVSILATGFDVVDVDYAAEHGIPVSNVPEYGTESVAQHTFALLLELTNDVARHDEAVRGGEWQRRGEFSFWLRPVVELSDLTLGIVGLGKIGRRVAEIGRAFGMRVVAHGRSEERPPPWHDFEWCDLSPLLESSDVVTLHCPLTPATHGMIGADELDSMKESALLVNTARGELVRSPALVEALETESIAGAAVDVVDEEPIPDDHPLLDAPRCLITPHMAWASLAARKRLMQTTADNIEAFLHGSPQHLITPA